ncbi:HypC/HybG/HupF family hydrogenase formation chaperone [Streptosporangium sandarakinum]|uniref:HypC/HybG/HupF family hydrogenase formation chaperone n=1 Tax=Streptosporangium sandarakinum TaxID=1260955 RepID=UPI00339F3C00
MSDEDGCCDTGPCVTCADEAVPMRVIRIRYGGLAVAGAGPVTTEVSVALVDAAEGDTVLVHAGEAIAVVGRHRRTPGDPAAGDAMTGDAMTGDAMTRDAMRDAAIGDAVTRGAATVDAAVGDAVIGGHRETR